MANSFYDHTTFPVPNAAGTSKSMRDELDAIEQGFDKFPQLTSSVSGLVLKVNSGGTAIETSSALSAFTISSSDITNSTLSNISMSAVGISNISATGTFHITASPKGKLLNVDFGSANSSTGNVFATNLEGTSAYISNIQASTTTVSRTATFATHWQFRDPGLGAYLFEGSSPAKFLLGSPPNQVVLESNGTACNIPELNVQRTAQMTYLRTFTGSASPNFVIDFNTGLITELNTATTTLGATNLGQVSALLSYKFDKAGGTVSGTALFTNQVSFSADINLLTNQITNLGSASSGLMAVNKNQLDNAIAGLVSSAPALLNTLGELSTALGDDPNFAATTASVLSTKLNLAGTNSMSGDLNLDSNKIINLATSSATHHAVNQAELNAVNSANLNVTGGSVGSISLTGDINLQSAHNVINAASVTANTTGTNLSTKEYVDRKGIALQMVYSI